MTRVARAANLVARFGGGGTRRLSRSAGLLIDHGRGSFLYEHGGARYLDAVSGFGVASVGHCHPQWVEAVVGQVRRLAVSPLYTDELAQYLAALAEVLPGEVAQTALFSGGAEAVEVAIRLAQTATGRPGILTFGESFHGKTLAVRYAGDTAGPEARAIGPSWLRELPFPECENHDASSYAHCTESAADVLAQCPVDDDIGAVLVEPVLGTAGNLPPRRSFLPELRRLCDEQGWLLLLDEMITGFGRTGRLFAAETFAVEPDVLVLGKGMGGGFPLSAVCASPELWKQSALHEQSATATSYGGNPIAAVAGRTTLEILMGAGFLEEVRSVGDHMARRLDDLARASRRVTRPRGVGLMLGFDLVNADTSGAATPESCANIFRACRDRGVLVAADVARVRLNPPLTLTVREADQLFDVLGEVLA